MLTINSIKKIFKPIDLTKGNIYRCLILFCLPIFISYLFQQVYLLSDAAIVGQNLSSAEIAGINDVGCLTFITFEFATGCTAGFCAITAKAVGAKIVSKTKKSIAIQLKLSLIIGILLTLFSMLFAPLLLKMINLNPETEVYKFAYTYYIVYCLGTIPVIFYNTIQSILRSIGDSITPLFFLIISTILNIFLDLFFVLVLKSGVGGVAFATILSQAICAVLCYIYTFIRYKDLRLNIKDFSFDWKYTFEHIKNGIPLGLEMSILSFGMIIMQAKVVEFDMANSDISQAAQLGYGAMNKYVWFIMTPFHALGTAMVSYMGQNNGAKQYFRIKKGLKYGQILMLILNLLLTIGTLLSCINGAYLRFFINDALITEDVIQYGISYFLINMPLFFTLGFLFIWRNALQGLELPLFPFLSGIGELISRILVSLFLPALIFPNNPFSIEAFYILMSADVCAWIFADIFLFIGIYKAIFKNKIIKESQDLENLNLKENSK